MKILNSPKEFKRWWAGQVADCRQCGTQIELEPDDRLDIRFRDGRDMVWFACPVCDLPIKFKRSQGGAAATALSGGEIVT
jgi:hypothetical protein